MQALYQMDIAATPLNDILAEFESHWIGREVEGSQYLPAEAAFFRSIVRGVLDEQRTLDPMIDKALQGGWPLKRVEALLRAVLRAGAFELSVAHGCAGARRRRRICRRRRTRFSTRTRPAWSTRCSTSLRGSCAPPSSAGRAPGRAVVAPSQAHPAEDG